MRAVRWRSRALTQAADSLISESLLAPPRAKLLARSVDSRRWRSETRENRGQFGSADKPIAELLAQEVMPN